MSKKKCEMCEKEFVKPYVCSKKDWELRKFCSRGCASKSFVGKPNSSKTKFRKGQVSHNKGKKMPEISGANHPQWKGGRIRRKGYIFLHRPDHPYCDSLGYVREHRLVMEEHLGRFLEPKEVVHHVNEVKDDNRLENLELFADNGKHTAHHLKHLR